MFGIDGPEFLIIIIILIVVVGPKDLPKMLRAFGRATARMRATATEFRRQFDEAMHEADLDDLQKTVSDLHDLDPKRNLVKLLDPLREVASDVRASIELKAVAPSDVQKIEPTAEQEPRAGEDQSEPINDQDGKPMGDQGAALTQRHGERNKGSSEGPNDQQSDQLNKREDQARHQTNRQSGRPHALMQDGIVSHTALPPSNEERRVSYTVGSEPLSAPSAGKAGQLQKRRGSGARERVKNSLHLQEKASDLAGAPENEAGARVKKSVRKKSLAMPAGGVKATVNGVGPTRKRRTAHGTRAQSDSDLKPIKTARKSQE